MASSSPASHIIPPPNTHYESPPDSSSAQILAGQAHKQSDLSPPSSTPVELSHLTSHPLPRRDSFTTASSNIPPSATPRLQDDEHNTVGGPDPAVAGQQEVSVATTSIEQPAPASAADHASAPIEAARTTPAVLITLLLTTGVRHLYDIDTSYLQQHNVAGASSVTDPFTISVYTMKELIWKGWREEWETRPSSPSAIRLIHFGRLLDDKSTLTECRFSPTTRNVVHMTVKPQEVVDEEENAKAGKGGHGRDRDEHGSVGCRCVIL